MRRTKIICTIGPKTSTPEALLELAKGGMNIARLNMSHGTHEWHGGLIDNIQMINSEGIYSIAIMLDTKGPEIRSGDLKQSIELKEGDIFTLTVRKQAEYEQNTTTVNYDGFLDDVEVGDVILVDSGVINLEVIQKTDTDVVTKALDSGTVTSRRHLNIRGKSANLPPITEKDWLDIDFAIEKKVDFIALSFVNSAKVVNELKNYLQKKGSDIHVISKIESTDAVTNMHEIVKVSDGVMVARGDLGAELPIEDVPIVQKDIVQYCRQLGTPVIVATQLLESMMVNPTPTRAEVTDIYYAVRQRTDCIMMSGETANGNHPFKALEVMSKVAVRTEEKFLEQSEAALKSSNNPKKEMSLGASVVANNIKAKAIIVFSKTGETARQISQCRPNSQIFAFTYNGSTQRKLSILWGTQSFSVNYSENPEENIRQALDILRNIKMIESGDSIVLVSDLLSGNEPIHSVQVRVVK